MLSKMSAGLVARELTPQETALIVMRYLQDNRFEQSSRAFAAEADSLLRLVQPPSAAQRVKGLHAVLNEYVALHARASRRATFERTFGDDGDVRGCLSRLTAVMDDYLALRNQQGQPPASRPAATCASAAASGAPALAVAASAAPSARPAGRKRKNARPQRRAHEEESAMSSRQLFGLASHGRTTPPPSSRGAGGGGWSWPLPVVDDEPGVGSSSNSGLLPGALGLPSLAPLDEAQLGEAIAQRINTAPVPRSRKRPAPSRGGRGHADEAASAGGVRVDEMSVDEIVHSLLSDPRASAMLSTLAAPVAGGAGTPVRAAGKPGGAGKSPVGGAPTPGAPHGGGHEGAYRTAAAPAEPPPPPHAPQHTSSTTAVVAPGVASAARPGEAPSSSAAPAAAPPAAIPPRVDIDSFLNRLHGKKAPGPR